MNYNLENVLPHIFVIKILSLGYRDKVKEFLAQNNIETGLHYFPNHKLDLYKEINHINLENTNKFFSQIITLPFHFDLIEKDIIFICKKIKEALEIE